MDFEDLIRQFNKRNKEFKQTKAIEISDIFQVDDVAYIFHAFKRLLPNDQEIIIIDIRPVVQQ